VLSGKLILTETNGTSHEYRPGDSLVLPVATPAPGKCGVTTESLSYRCKKADRDPSQG